MPSFAKSSLTNMLMRLLALFCDWIENGEDTRYCGHLDRQFLPQAGDVFYEGAPETCPDCNCQIESAYGNPDEEEEEND